MKITEYLAIYAACLSSIVFIWNMRRATSRVTVQIIFGVEEVDGETVGGAYISVKNPSSQTVHLARVSPLYPSNKPSLLDMLKHIVKYKRLPWNLGWVHTSFSYFDIDDGCPTSLASGKSHDIFIPEEIINKLLEEADRRSLKAVAQ